VAAEGCAIQGAGALLMARLCKPQRLPKVLVPTAIHEVLRRQSQAAGITTAEAVRQLLAQALAYPMGSPAGEEESRRVALAPVNAPADLVLAIRSRAAEEKVSVAEAVRRGLNETLNEGRGA